MLHKQDHGRGIPLQVRAAAALCRRVPLRKNALLK